MGRAKRVTPSKRRRVLAWLRFSHFGPGEIANGLHMRAAEVAAVCVSEGLPVRVAPWRCPYCGAKITTRDCVLCSPAAANDFGGGE
jgi:hypothetical protein